MEHLHHQQDGDLLVLFDELYDSDKAHGFAEDLSRKSVLTLRSRYTPW
jgi:hypothetical protein